MLRKRLLFVLVTLCALSLITACTKTYKENSDDEEEQEANYSAEEDENDYVWDSSDIVYITLNGTTITVDGEGATVDGSIVTIESAGTYSISGSLTNGQVVVDTDNDTIVRLILNSASITCSNSSPVYIKKAGKVVLITQEGTTNYLTDGTSYNFDDAEEMEPNAPLFSKSYISFFGTGKLVVDGNYGDGIVGKDGLVIKSGTLDVTSVDDGIRGKDYIVVWDGDITVNAGGDGMKTSIETDNTLGFITIDNGAFDITSKGDAISAITKINILYAEMTLKTTGTASAKGLKAGEIVVIDDGVIGITSIDDAIHSNGSLTINSGEITLSTSDDAVHAESELVINGGDVTITKSYEAIEAPYITVNDGNISIVASNDGFNASMGTGSERDDGSKLIINGGYMVSSVSNGDGLDSNGSLSINGGTILVHGPSSSPEVGMDVNGSCDFNGGFIAISGSNSNMTYPPSTSSSQYSVLIKSNKSLSSSTIFHIEDASGNNLLTFQPSKTYYSIIFSSSSLQNGSTYYIYTGGSSTGTKSDGLYTEGQYTPGTAKTSFKISQKVTTISIS